MPRAVAINVGANSSLPGFRGPIDPDGSFVYVPIPEREPVAEPVPTYADLDLPIEIPAEHRDTPIHLDPAFEEYPCCETYTYGDEHGVKAAPLLGLDAGDFVLFYATLDVREYGEGPGIPPRKIPAILAEHASADSEADGDWRPPEWGAFVIGGFRLDRDPIVGEAYPELPAVVSERLASNAHVKRETVDAEVLLLGDERSGLLDVALPLSQPSGGADANAIVTELSADSGAGPWWRRPLRFDAEATGQLLDALPMGDP